MKHFFHHLFFPRESNNHRSKLLHHDSLLLTIVLFLFCGALASVIHTTHPSVLGISVNIPIGDLLSLTNQKRQENGLPPLQLNGMLSQAAEGKAQDMFAKNYWAHIAPDGTTPWYFIKSAGYEYLYAGENLARGFNTASDTVNAWMASPSHRENMLSKNYNEVGFAVSSGTLTGSETVLVVEMFGSRYINAAPQQQELSAVIPTATIAPAVSSPTPSPSPSPSPTLVVSPTASVLIQKTTSTVAAVENKPLVDSRSTTRQVSFIILFLFIAVFVIDAIIIERKKIARVVSHNLDHILFLGILLLAAILIGKGLIL